ncbi:MAG: hypothetical protein INR62_03985 [Rhodospirillales bacterium]|nr:hypothetical protein [Acetobacter sp.]
MTIVCVLCCLATARAVDPAAKTRAETFFRTVIGGDTSKAFDALMEGSLIPTSQPDAVSRLKSQLETGLRVYGRPVGFDLLEEKAFGPSLVRCVYIFRLEKYPLVWQFFFYKGADRWLPVNVRFNDSLAPFDFDRPTSAAAADSAPQD